MLDTGICKAEKAACAYDGSDLHLHGPGSKFYTLMYLSHLAKVICSNSKHAGNRDGLLDYILLGMVTIWGSRRYAKT